MTETTSTRAVLALVFGILAITGTCPCIGSFAAILLGAGERSGVGRAGVILGWVSLLMWLVIALLAVLGLGVAVVADVPVFRAGENRSHDSAGPFSWEPFRSGRDGFLSSGLDPSHRRP
jgi:hypothetical protein